MLHLVLYVLLAIVVAVGLFLVASRFLPAGEQIAPAIRDEPVWELPAERSLQAEDVDTVRLPVALRGYRFAETDVLLDRLAGELRARDAEIERLRGSQYEAEPVDAASGPAAGADAPYAPPRPRPVAPAETERGPGPEPDPVTELDPATEPDPATAPDPATDPGGDDRP